MKIEISEELAKAIGSAKLEPYGIDPDRMWRSEHTIDLGRIPLQRAQELLGLVKPHKVRGQRNALRDLKTWIEAANVGAASVKCKDTRQFSTLVRQYLADVPKHWLYHKDSERGHWQARYVSDIHYSPKKVDNGYTTPASTTLDLTYEELGDTHEDKISFDDAHVRDQTVPEILHKSGLFTETPELLAEHTANVEKLSEIGESVGLQFRARGLGTADLDGEYRWNTNKLQMERDGVPSRVVIDVLQESDEDRRGRSNARHDADFWRKQDDIDDDEDAGKNGKAETPNEPPPEIPIWPTVPTFDLRRHCRLRIHVADLTPYVYDPSLGEKLILPEESRDLVRLLLANKGEFNDIIGGKGDGAVILCAGPPGVGKTLTAEVYAEVMKRPLYSVQASQLGTDEEELEKELIKVFSRAQRWDAILLLDEADVYVASRGSDLQQNAIVGVFLRVLEYYGGTLFMTTNRADLVDDAIASRCIARIDYELPSPADLTKIWKILSSTAGIPVSDATIAAVVEQHPNLSGRDVKQLLKLARAVAKSYGVDEITPEIISFVKKFKPTVERR